MENCKFLKLKSMIPDNYYKDSKELEFMHSPSTFKKSLKNSVKFSKKASKNSLLRGKLLKQEKIVEKATEKIEENALTEKVLDETLMVKQDHDNVEPIVNFNFNIQPDNIPVSKEKKRDAKGQLNVILKKKQKLKELEKQDPVKSLELEQDHKWRKALALADGKKIKDDPTLLKKSLNRIKKNKKKSETEWKNRIKSTNKSIMDRQKKRLENIQNKKLRNKKGKGKKSRPGFEGKSKK